MTTERWALGGGDLRVARIGYGTMKLTGWPQGNRPSREVALAVLRRAVELGVNHIDTSHYYSRDGVAANELIREALHPYPADLVIVTKVGALVEGSDIALPAAQQTGLTPDNLRRGVEANLRSLGVDRVDVVNLRMGDAGRGAARRRWPRRWRPCSRCARRVSSASWASPTSRPPRSPRPARSRRSSASRTSTT